MLTSCVQIDQSTGSLGKISEIRKAVKFLRLGDIRIFGELINLSHEGDRVSINGTDRFEPDISNVYLDQCISFLEKDENYDSAQIYRQPGARHMLQVVQNLIR